MAVETPIEPMPDQPDFPLLEGVSVEASQLHANFKAVDPRRNGVGLDRIRPFYPKVGWSVILTPANELIQAGFLKKRPVMNAKGSVGHELYTWQTV